MINEFVNDVCDILNIKVPEVSFDTSNFQTLTMMAQCSPSGDVIYIKEYDKPNPDQLFSIAHELRHIWQMSNDRSYYFANYKPANACDSVESYNLQVAEVDANAFSMLVMSDFFGIKPLFNGLSEAVKQRIYKRAEEIKKEISQ